MQKLIPLFSVLFFPSVALAHPGHHSGPETSLIVHWLTQPDHLLLSLAGIAGVIGLGVALVSFARKSWLR